MKSNDSGRSGRRPGRGQRRPSSRPRSESRPSLPPAKKSFWQKLIGFFTGAPKKAKTNGASAATERERTSKTTRRPEAVDVTSPKLYVGNLSFEAAENDLLELFSGVGVVKNAEIVTHRDTERSKGFGFVLMTTTDEAKRAVNELHDKPFLGRKLVVTGAKASEREPNYRG